MSINQYFSDTTFCIPDAYVLITYDFFTHASITIVGWGVWSTITSPTEGELWLKQHKPSEIGRWRSFHSLRKDINRKTVLVHPHQECAAYSFPHKHEEQTAYIPYKGIRYPSTVLVQEIIDGEPTETIEDMNRLSQTNYDSVDNRFVTAEVDSWSK